MRGLQRALVFVAVSCIAGCSVDTILQPTRDPSQFYILSPMDSSARGVPLTYSGTPGHRALEIGLGPIKFPAYLERPQVVTRNSANQVDLSEFNRWAEPLQNDFLSVLGQNLAVLLGAHVTPFPWYRPLNLDYQVTLDITRFDTDSQGTAQLVGRWEIKDPDSGEVQNSGQLNIVEKAQPHETPAATLSRALGELSSQLADAISAAKPPAPRVKSD
jgi:uncharacterized lipoprotein YmbA